MLEISLLLENDTVRVLCGGAPSHAFPLRELALTEKDIEDFFIDPSGYGLLLYMAVFQQGSAACEALNRLAPGARLVLRLDAPELAGTPWEALFDGKRWLAEHYAFLRAGLKNAAGPNGRPAGERTRLLFVPASPLLFGSRPAPYALDVEGEWRELRGALEELNPPCELVKVLPPSLDALHAATAGSAATIIHFSGHGGQDEKAGARLYFEEASGAAQEVPGADFCLRARGAALVVLSACLSAAPGESEEANLAGALAAQGIPFVLGMQLTVGDARARAFTTRFYRFLFGGADIPEAVMQARAAIDDDRLAMAIPVLYAADPSAAGRLPAGGGGLKVAGRDAPVDLRGVSAAERGFFGRHHELVQVGALLTAPRRQQNETFTPLAITLHGTGGIGKTALLRRAAGRFAWAFPDGVLGISLEPLPASPGVVLERIERFFGLPDGGALDVDARVETAVEGLQGRRALLALDNFESLAYAREGEDAEKKRTAAAIFRLLRALPARGLTLIASSRELTHLPGEKVIPVFGLDDAAGAKLFASGVQQRGAELENELLYELNRRVGGHALALRLLGPVFDHQAMRLEAFLEQLEEILPQAGDEWGEGRRHDTLAACFAFSLDALQGKDAPLQEAIARLSLFRGSFLDWTARPVLFGWTTDEELAKIQQAQAAGTLRALAEHGLLEEDLLVLDAEATLRFYRLHPALRPFAAARLGGAQRESARDGYWYAMLWLSGRAYPHEEDGRWVGIHSSPGLVEIVRRALPDLLDACGQREDAGGASLRFRTADCLGQFGDLDGAMALYRQSLEIKERLGDPQGKSATLHAMAYIYVTRGDLDGAMELYRQALEIDERLGDQQGKSTTLHAMANIYVTRGELDGAMDLYRQAQEICERLGDQRGKGATLHEMAYILRTRGDLDGAMDLYRQSLEIKERLGDQQGKSATLRDMAYILRVRGELDGAMELYRQSLEICERLGDQRGKGATLHEMAYILRTRGDLDGAMDLYRQSLEIKERLGDQQGKSATLRDMAYILRVRGELDGAMELYRQSLEIKERLGDQQGKSATLHEMAYILRVRGELDGAMELYRQSLEIGERLGDPQGKAMTLGMMAQLLWQGKQHETALAHLVSGLSILVQLRIEPRDQKTIMEILAGWRNELGAAQFDLLWEKVIGGQVPGWLKDSGQGQGMSVEQWVRDSVRAAKRRSAEGKELYELARKVGSEGRNPEPIRKLAGVLQRILGGNLAPDLSGLPEELAALVRAALAED